MSYRVNIKGHGELFLESNTTLLDLIGDRDPERKPEDDLFVHTAQRMVEEIEEREDMLERMQAYQDSLVP